MPTPPARLSTVLQWSPSVHRSLDERRHIFLLDLIPQTDARELLLDCLITAGVGSFRLHRTFGPSEYLIETWLTERRRRLLVERMSRIPALYTITDHEVFDPPNSDSEQAPVDASEVRKLSAWLRGLQERLEGGVTSSSHSLPGTEDIELALHRGFLVAQPAADALLNYFLLLLPADPRQHEPPAVIASRIRKMRARFGNEVGAVSRVDRAGIYVTGQANDLSKVRHIGDQFSSAVPLLRLQTFVAESRVLSHDRLDLDAFRYSGHNAESLLEDSASSALRELHRAPLHFRTALEARLDERKDLLNQRDDRERISRILECFLNADSIGFLEATSFALWIEPLLRQYLLGSIAHTDLPYNESTRPSLRDLQKSLQRLPDRAKVEADLGRGFDADLTKAIRIKNKLAHGRLRPQDFDLGSKQALALLDDLICAGSLFGRLRRAEQRYGPGSLRLLTDET